MAKNHSIKRIPQSNCYFIVNFNLKGKIEISSIPFLAPMLCMIVVIVKWSVVFACLILSLQNSLHRYRTSIKIKLGKNGAKIKSI